MTTYSGNLKGIRRQFISLSAISLLIIGISIGTANAGPPSFQQAVADYQAKRYQAALEKFKVISASYPNNALCHYYLGMTQQALGHIEQAKQEYQLSIQYGDVRLKQLGQQGLSILGGARTQIAYGGGSSPAPRAFSGGSNAGATQSKGKVKKIYEFYADW